MVQDGTLVLNQLIRTADLARVILSQLVSSAVYQPMEISCTLFVNVTFYKKAELGARDTFCDNATMS